MATRAGINARQDETLRIESDARSAAQQRSTGCSAALQDAPENPRCPWEQALGKLLAD
jgi:hypothetical protein